MPAAGAEEDEEAQERQPFDTNAEILPSKRVKADKASGLYVKYVWKLDCLNTK